MFALYHFLLLYPASSGISLFIILLLCWTRFFRGTLLRSKTPNGEHLHEVGMLPYWIPVIGHLLSFIVSPDHFLQRCSYRSPHAIFSLNLASTTHNIVSTPSLIKTVFKQPAPVVDNEDLGWYVILNVFGGKKRHKELLMSAFNDLYATLTENLLRDPPLSEVLHVTITAMQEHMPNLVSFAPRPIDQNLWERSGDPIIHLDCSQVEVSLFPLIRNFVGYMSLPSLMGTDFVEYYPSVFDDLWDLDSGFNYLLLGLPRWFPMRSLTKAHLARFRLHNALTEFHKGLDHVAAGEDPPSPWRDLTDVSQLMKDRGAVYRSHGIAPEMRGPLDLGIIWAMNANANNLVFWMLVRLYATPGLVDQLREEMAPFANAFQPPRIFGLPEPPRLQLALDGLIRSCPLLKACYLECLRLDSEPTSIKSVKQDFIVTETEDDVLEGVRPMSFVLRAGTFVHIPLAVHQLDPRFFPSPNAFRPERFLQLSDKDDGKLIAHHGTLKPWGGGHSICKGRIFAEREILAFVAGVVSLWDMKPAGPGGWKVPSHRRSTAVALPASDIRVALQRRDLRGASNALLNHP